MTLTAFLFFFFATLQIAAAVAMITVKNPVHSVLLLIVTFICGSGLWLLLQAEFLGIVLILVYVGAVMVLFLFVVMMLDINVEEMRAGFARYAIVGVPVAIVMGLIMSYALKDQLFANAKTPILKPAEYSNTEELGRVLYTDYVFQFELAAVILLVAMIAAIALTFRRRPGTKHQNPAEQVKVRKEDRLRVVSMKSEKE